MNIMNDTIRILEKALDVRMANNRVIASNLANVDTPGFQANRMDFEETMRQVTLAIEAGESDPQVEAIILPTSDPAVGLDGNNVNMEKELGALTANGTQYQLTARLLAAKLREIQTILDSGA